MLCACSGEQFKLEEPVPRSPESLATRDFSASGLSSSRAGTVDWDSKFDDAQVDEAESTLKEALSLKYEEARALLGRLEYQKGNFDAALQVFYGIDIRTLSPSMTKAINERQRTRQQCNQRSKGEHVPVGAMSLHSVSLLLEAILLKAKSLEELGKTKEAARECKLILDIIESALPNGMIVGIFEDCKLQEMLHKALELLPKLWIQAGIVSEAIVAYRRALIKPWNLEPQRLANVQKDLAAMLLYGGVEACLPPQSKLSEPTNPNNNTEEAILLLLVLMRKVLFGEIKWDAEIINHLTFALSMISQFECLANHFEQILPGTCKRAERWFSLALCYSASGKNETALNLLRKASGFSEEKHEPYLPSFLLGAKLCSQDPKHAREGINFARKVIEMAKKQNKHLVGIAHKYLGVCYGNAARASLLDSERMIFHTESINSLNQAALFDKNDPEIFLDLGIENAVQRNLDRAFENTISYSDMVAGSSGRAWKLLTLIVSGEQRFKDAETIVDLALVETGRVDQLELLRLKAVLQIAQEQPRQAIETYRVLLSTVQTQGENQEKIYFEEKEKELERRLEIEAWLDLAKIYSDLGSLPNAETCLGKVKSKEFYFPRGWHSTGKFFEAKLMYKEALIAYSISLSIEPDYVPSIISSAQALVKMGSQTNHIARSFLMNALRLEPTNHEAWFNLGLICKKEGLVQHAADFFQAAHELMLSAPVQNFQFGLPRKIVSDRGTQFSEAFTAECKRLNIEHVKSSVARPEGNGQAEAANKLVLAALTKNLDGKGSRWVDELPAALWAVRTTMRNSTGETPFFLTYGSEAMAPVEPELPTHRVAHYSEEANRVARRADLDLLDEERVEAAARMVNYKQKAKAHHDKKVKKKSFNVGDFVWRKAEATGKQAGFHKFDANWEGPYEITRIIREGTYRLRKDGKDLKNAWHADHLKKCYK